MRKLILAILVSVAFFPFVATTSAYADDVYVQGYYRKDGTYVRPHIRSAPDNSIDNNYGPSTDNSQLMNPHSRDYDGDGTPNYLDSDSDNDGTGDNSDSNPYGYR